MTSKALILRHLTDYGSITAWEAVKDYGIMRLGARVWDLRHAGYPIATHMEVSVNRYGMPVRYARYTLEADHE